jgi:hypothetical protein
MSEEGKASEAEKAAFARAFVNVLRELSRLQADNRSLASILQYVETQGHLPVEGWLATLKAMRETPQYKTISEEHEEMFRRVEEFADIRELQELLAKLPPTKYEN